MRCHQDSRLKQQTYHVDGQQPSADVAPGCVELFCIVHDAGKLDVHPHEEDGQQRKQEAEEDDNNPARRLHCTPGRGLSWLPEQLHCILEAT